MNRLVLITIYSGKLFIFTPDEVEQENINQYLSDAGMAQIYQQTARAE